MVSSPALAGAQALEATDGANNKMPLETKTLIITKELFYQNEKSLGSSSAI
jgi:hypothetical protein